MEYNEKAILEARKQVCNRILTAMLEKDWSQKKLADQWGKPESQVSKVLNGKVDMQLSTLTELEEVLGVELVRKDWRPFRP